MQLPRERVLFVVVVVLLAWFVRGDLSQTSTRLSRAGGEDLEYVPPPLPDVARALPRGERDGGFERDLFSPPSDTEPLAPLDLEAPELAPLPWLAPPAAWGPVAAHMGDFLREAHALTPRPELFEEPLEGEGQDEQAMEEAAVAFSELDPEERAAVTAGYKRQYDWILLGDYKYGSIQNRDRYGLARRPGEAILFEEVDPASGRPRFAGADPIAYERERVTEFGFADTVPNRIELRLRLEFHDELRPTQLDEALAFAGECVAWRLDAPRALEVAEDVYRRARSIADGDPGPLLGLARCYEAGFRFEEAYGVYRELLDGPEARNPVVHARLGDLLARLRVFGEAEAAYREAIRWGATDWEARWRYGRFLLHRWRPAEAVEQLEVAAMREVSTPETRRERTALRTDLGWALVQAGRAAEARVAFERALALDETAQEALAGLVSVDALLAGEGAAAGARERVDSATDAGFDLLHARGLAALRAGDWTGARELLERAAQADPFRAHLPLRALAFLASRTDNGEEALDLVQRAAEVDPTDTYTLYHRGRVLAERDDLEAAAASLRAALDRELRFPEALAAMGTVQARTGEHLAAERYFERSLGEDPEQVDVHVRRAYNLLELGDVQAAEAAFLEALRRDPDEPAARLGVAWCAYLGEEPFESVTLYADLIESRRGAGEGDPWVRYAEVQIERVRDHLEKELWRDRFDRRSGVRLGNGWNVDQRQGIDIRLQDGQVVLEGMATTGGRTRLYQELPAGRYVSHEMTVTVDPGTGSARVGIFLSRERETRGESVTQAEVALGRSPDGALGYRVVQRGETDPLFVDLPAAGRWTPGVPVRLKIERYGSGSDATFTLFQDGVPVLEGERVPSLGSSSAALRYGLFIEIEANRQAKVLVDDVEVIRRQSL